MLRLIPAPLHRLLYRIAHRLRRGWWNLRRPQMRGCRILALDCERRVLLVRHSYGSGAWMPPSGGLARGESAVAGAVRELHEETACHLEDAVELEIADEWLGGAANAVHVVVGRTDDAPRADRREVMEAAFFALDRLPDSLSPTLRMQLPQWITAATAGRPARDRLQARPPAPIK